MDTLTGLTIQHEQVETEDVSALLAAHFALMRSQSPEESCHVMTADALIEADVTLLGARDGGVLLGVGAMKCLDADHGELKSMHTVKEARGRGVGALLLRGLIEAARQQGLTRLSLETGSDPEFTPARALYAAHEFEECPPFGEYVLDPLSVFMTRSI